MGRSTYYIVILVIGAITYHKIYQQTRQIFFLIGEDAYKKFKNK